VYLCPFFLLQLHLADSALKFLFFMVQFWKGHLHPYSILSFQYILFDITRTVFLILANCLWKICSFLYYEFQNFNASVLFFLYSLTLSCFHSLILDSMSTVLLFALAWNCTHFFCLNPTERTENTC
jgi:hypothetical protein